MKTFPTASAARFLQEEEIDSGILVGREDKLRFWHRTFQEDLAARELAKLGANDAGRGRLLFEDRKLYVSEWRESNSQETGSELLSLHPRTGSGARQMLSLADLIRQRAQTMVLGPSSTPT